MSSGVYALAKSTGTLRLVDAGLEEVPRAVRAAREGPLRGGGDTAGGRGWEWRGVGAKMRTVRGGEWWERSRGALPRGAKG
jgi:hypothetical protein